MLLRRLFPLAIAMAAACAPDVPGRDATQPSSADVAVFDPANSKVPQPNDLAFQALPTLQGAAKELIQTFAAAGGFPSDQDTPIAIDLQHQLLPSAAGPGPTSAPQLDVTSIIPCPAPNCNVAVFEKTATSVSPVTLQPPAAADYVAAPDHGTLFIRRKKQPLATNPSIQTSRWNPGSQYIAALRGGPNGVRTLGGGAVNPSAVFYLLLLGTDLSLPQNETLIPGTPAEKAAAGAQLEKLRQSYLPAFAVVDQVFPRQELAVLSTFTIAQARPTAYVEFDQYAGTVPLPSDFLLDSTGHISARASQAFGPLASGMRTLDGFSTTAMVLARTSGAVDVASLAGNVYLYKLDLAKQTATLVKDATTGPGATYVLEPPQLNGSCGPGNPSTSTTCVLGLQPAVPVPLPGNNTLALPPLEENTEYAVLISDGVRDSATQTAISRNTIVRILTFQNPLADSTGRSLLPGVDDGTAAGLELMRKVLQIPIAASGVGASHVAMAYTFKTQTVTGKNSFDPTTLALKPGVDPGALGLAALPYQVKAANPAAFTPGAVTTLTPTAAFSKYGIENSAGDVAPPVPTTAIDSVLEFTLPLLSYLSDATGAFDPVALQSGQGKGTPVTVLVSVPLAANVANACPPQLGLPNGTKCAPLAIFHHGLGATKATMLTVANELNLKGIVVAAIDAPLHGDRAYCAKNSECSAGGTCVPNTALAGQGDTTPPGTCSTSLAHVPQLCAGTNCVSAWVAAGGANGQTLASAEYFISGNFFRTRDVNRQGVIDHSALALALSPLAAGPLNTFQTALLARGIFVAPASPSNVANVSWVGQSYGSIMGTVNVAANPRITSAVLNVGGGTSVDIFSTKGSTFYPTLQKLLGSLGVQFDANGNPTPATAGLYLQFLNIAKWILDPSDPINFAGYTTVTGKTLPNLLLKQPTQPRKPVLGQIAQCDSTVPNPTNFELDLGMNLSPLYNGTNQVQSTALGGPGATVTTFIDGNAAGGACVGVPSASPGTVPHGFITSWGISYDANNTPLFDAVVRLLTQDAQDQGAAFLIDPTNMPSNVQVRP